jgi:hypothetical protein
MNIFHLSDCPIQSAKWQVDRHAVKMGLEQTQMFCTAFWLQNIDAPYKCISNPTHRSAVWMRKSKDYALALFALVLDVADLVDTYARDVHWYNSLRRN